VVVGSREREVVDIWEKRLWSYYFVRQEEQNMIIYLAGNTILPERERNSEEEAGTAGFLFLCSRSRSDPI